MVFKLDDYLSGMLSICDECSRSNSVSPVDVVECESHVHVGKQVCKNGIQLFTVGFFFNTGDTDRRSSAVLFQVVQ